MDVARKMVETAALGLYGLYQTVYWLVSGRGHPGFDGLWRYRCEFSRIWGIRRAQDRTVSETAGADPS
jgi:hypothetical protein